MHFKPKFAIAMPVLALLAGLSAVAPANAGQTVTEIVAGQTGEGEMPETLVNSSDEIVVAANKKRRGPKERDNEASGIQAPAPKDCVVQKRKGGPKGDKGHGIKVQDLVDGIAKKGGPKGDVDHGLQDCAVTDPVPVPSKHRGPKGGGRDKILTN